MLILMFPTFLYLCIHVFVATCIIFGNYYFDKIYVKEAPSFKEVLKMHKRILTSPVVNLISSLTLANISYSVV